MDSCLAIPELLEKIVVFLDTSDLFKATRVCRAWQDAFLKYAFRDFVYLRNNGPQELIEHGRHVHRLKAFSVLDEDLEAIGLYCPNIKSLEICTEQVSMDAFDRFCQRMTGLESLHLHLGQTFPAQLILASFATHSWPHLTTLSLTGNPPFAPHTLSTNIHHNILYHALVACSSTLVHLRLENMRITPNLHYVSVESMPQETQQKWSISSLLSNLTKPAPAAPIHPVDSSAYSIHLREVQKKEPWRKFISVNTDENIPELVRVRSMVGSPFQSANQDGNAVANDHGNKEQDKGAIEWKCLRTLHFIKFYDESNRRLFLNTILQRCQNLQELRLEKSSIAVDTIIHLKKLQMLYVEASSTYHSRVLERCVVNILAPGAPELKSLTLITVFHSLASNEIPHGRLDQLEELTRMLALGAETRDVDRILSHNYPCLRKLKLIGMKWGESPAMNPSQWRCRSTLQEFEGGLIVPFWGRSEGEAPVPSVQDVYRHLPALWRVRLSQQRFRLLCGWLSGMTSLEKLYNDAKAGEETSSNDGGGDEIVDDEGSQRAVIESSTISTSEDNAEFDTQGSSIIQIRVIEVERLEEEDELPLLKKELQVVLRAFPNLETLFYVGRKNPFTAEAWEWARRVRPDLRMEHLITRRL
ncbi:hypothetical protein BGW42_006356 [Actinomortierella wolfii]|nr:hypothetical protein BGW42_006356 [Actinomortierella wolfii]